MSIVATRIARLLRLALSTDAPGEALAANVAVRRALETAGFDIHDAADAIERHLGGAAQERQSTSEPPPPRQSPFPDEPARSPREWSELCEQLLRYASILRLNEIDFLENMIELTADDRHPTPKQALWVLAIYRRVAQAVEGFDL